MMLCLFIIFLFLLYLYSVSLAVTERESRRLIRFTVVELISHLLKYEIVPSKGFGS